MEIRIPPTFLADHHERDLPTPHVIRQNARSAYIDHADPNLAELLDDARHYAHPNGPDSDYCIRVLKPAAKALLQAVGYAADRLQLEGHGQIAHDLRSLI